MDDAARTDPIEAESASGPSGLVAALLVLLPVAALLFYARPGCPLQEPQEPRYAEIARQMLSADSLVVPLYHGSAYLDKPPLLYWLVMASYAVFGIHDWAARLVPCTAAFLCVLVVYGWARRTAGARAALLGALLLCLSARFVQLERLLTMDGLLCLWIVAAWGAAHAALQHGQLRWRWWLVSALACGLGLLTKGPVALVLVVIPVLVYQMIERRSARPRFCPWLLYLVVALASAAPWFIAVQARCPDFAGYFFVHHHVERFREPFDHDEPFWFYVPELLVGMFPWTLLLPGLALHLFRPDRTLAPSPFMGEGRGGGVERPGLTVTLRPPTLTLPHKGGGNRKSFRFYLLACGWTVAFFSLAGCKRPAYILPALPPLALALGCFLDAVLPRPSLRSATLSLFVHHSAWAGRATALLLLAALAAALAALLRGLLRPEIGIVLAGGAAGMLGGLLALLRYRRPAISWGLCVVVSFAVLLAAFHQLAPAYARQYSLRGLVRRHATAAEQRLPVASYPRRWDSVSFYLQRDDVRAYTPERRAALIADLQQAPQTLVFVKSERWLADFLEHLPAGLEFVPCGRQGYVKVGIVQPR
jgi:4-amino-4-deoxy-L-arabinose transferase-like glycosyltransferase